MKSIFFSEKIDLKQNQSTDNTLTLSAPFAKTELLKDLIAKLKAKGYVPDNVTLIKFVNRNHALYLEGTAHEIQTISPGRLFFTSDSN